MNHPPMQLPVMTFASKVFHIVIPSCHSFKKNSWWTLSIVWSPSWYNALKILTDELENNQLLLVLCLGLKSQI